MLKRSKLVPKQEISTKQEALKKAQTELAEQKKG